MKYAVRSVILSILMLLVGFSLVKVFSEPYFAGRLNKETYLLISFVLLLALNILRLLEKKFYRGSLIILFFPAIIVFTGKIIGLLGCVVFLIASLGFGLVLVKKIKIPDNLLKYILCLFFGIAANSYLIWLLMHFRVNYFFTYYLLFLSEIWLFREQLVDGYLKYRQGFISYRLSPGQKILILMAIVHLFYALVSNYLWMT